MAKQPEVPTPPAVNIPYIWKSPFRRRHFNPWQILTFPLWNQSHHSTNRAQAWEFKRLGAESWICPLLIMTAFGQLFDLSGPTLFKLWNGDNSYFKGLGGENRRHKGLSLAQTHKRRLLQRVICFGQVPLYYFSPKKYKLSPILLGYYFTVKTKKQERTRESSVSNNSEIGTLDQPSY